MCDNVVSSEVEIVNYYSVFKLPNTRVWVTCKRKVLFKRKFTLLISRPKTVSRQL